jgi:hypothetical protein
MLHMPKRPAGNRLAATAALVAVWFLLIGCQQGPNPAIAPQTDSDAKKSRTAVPAQSGDPGNIPAKELSAMLKGVPDALRRDKKDVQLARELGIRAWAVDFTDGPMICWLEIEETGQRTIEPRPYGGPGEIFLMGTDAARGRILWWFRPGAHSKNPSARSRRIMQRLGTSAEGISEIMAISGAGLGGFDEAAEPPVPRLWSSWNDVTMKDLSRPAKVRPGEETTLFAIEATEKEPPQESKPRKVKLMLKVKPKSTRP